MPSKIPPTLIRIDPVLLEKFRYIAASNDRSMNKEIARLMRKYVSDYEARYGKIELDEAQEDGEE